MVESISRLNKILKWWEFGEYLSALLVIIGVVGEFVADFTNLFGMKNNPKRKNRLERGSTLLLIIALGAARREQYSTLFLLAAASGLRIGELLALRNDDIGENTIRVDESVDC